MANLTLSQLRAAQLANPPHLDEYGERIANLAREKLLDPAWKPNPEWETAPGRFPGLEPDAYKSINIPPVPGVADCPPAELSLPLQASNPAQSATPGAGGYCRIFPADFASLAHVTPDWKAQNWVGNGPWQHLEGWPVPPDFEANLLAVEETDVVKPVK